MLNAIQGGKLHVHCYAWSEALSSMKLYAHCYTRSEAMCLLLYME